MKKKILTLVGVIMGLAEVVPGVSGGTIAFVAGIYERLIRSIKSIDKTAFQFLFQRKFRAFSGMIAGLVVGVFGISYLLEHHPVAIWSFFFGLILASSVYLGLMIKSWNTRITVSYTHLTLPTIY